MKGDVGTSSPGVLERALEITRKNREKERGHPFYDFSKVAQIWNAIKPEGNVEPQDVALFMIGVKLARIAQERDIKGYPVNVDHADDIAGYADCFGRCEEEGQRLKESLDTVFEDLETQVKKDAATDHARAVADHNSQINGDH